MSGNRLLTGAEFREWCHWVASMIRFQWAIEAMQKEQK